MTKEVCIKILLAKLLNEKKRKNKLSISAWGKNYIHADDWVEDAHIEVEVK